MFTQSEDNQLKIVSKSNVEIPKIEIDKQKFQKFHETYKKIAYSKGYANMKLFPKEKVHEISHDTH